MSDSSQAESDPAARPRQALVSRLIEVGLIGLLFLLYVGPLTPEVNEAHYLAKARHYWNPQWCPDDHFLNSADAHGVFYWSFGWVTTLMSLPAAAWAGRLICWLAIALSWQRLVWVMYPRPWAALGLVTIGLAGIHYTHMAGEWLVGGVEAKCFAYAFALWALGDALVGRWNRAWILLGVTSAFHVLVGGWMVVCLLIGWGITGRRRISLVAMLPGLACGGLISLVGIIPLLQLNAEIPPEQSRWANYVYVFERLSHHLVVHTFAPLLKIRFALVSAVWLASAWLLRRSSDARLLNAVVAGSLVLVVIGIAIDQFLVYWRYDYFSAAVLLRFYWYRIADILVPLGLAINLGLLASVYGNHHARAVTVGAVALGLAVGGGLVVRIADRWTADASPADRSSLVSSPSAWETTCRWIAQNTPAEAIFLTPRLQSTFKWYAQRAEVVTTKDVPQDDHSLLEWRGRRVDVHWRPYSQHQSLSLAALSTHEVQALAERYDFRYVVVDRVLARQEGYEPAWPFVRVYPPEPEASADYEVYEVAP